MDDRIERKWTQYLDTRPRVEKDGRIYREATLTEVLAWKDTADHRFEMIDGRPHVLVDFLPTCTSTD
jgi:hypothetical protein